MKKSSIYGELAKYYDIIYLNKNYKKETEQIKKIVKVYKKSDGTDLLDVGCGTGKHLQYLKRSFKCVGVDQSPELLKIARQNVKGVVFKKADMTDFELKKKFDVIISLFTAIGYVKTKSNLKKTLSNLSKHLNPGGVIIIDPWYTKADIKKIAKTPWLNTYKKGFLTLTRNAKISVRGDISTIDFDYFIQEKGKPEKQFSDKHQLGLFATSEIIRILNQHGLKAKFLKKGLDDNNRGLIIATKRLPRQE